MQYSSAFLFFPAAVLALQVTSPSKGDTWNAGQSQTVKFDKVSSDPSSVDVVLVNMNVYPTTSMTVGSNIDTSSGSFTIPGKDVTGSGSGFQINLVNPSNNGILAQSGTFDLAASNSASSSSGTSGSSSGSATTISGTSSASATKSTASSSGTSSASSSASSTSGTASSSSSSTTPSSTRNAASAMSVEMNGLLGVIFAGFAALL